MKISAHRGFTLIEVTIVLMVLAILAAVLVPSIGGFNSLARGVRVSEDLGAICSVLKMMLDDMRDSAFFGRYGSTRYTSSAYGIASGGSSSYGYGSSGVSVTETLGSAGYRIEAPTPTPACQPAPRTSASGYAASGEDWCDNCNMPRSQCGDDCMDDCDENCTHSAPAPMAAPTSVSTITRSYGGGSASGGSTTMRYSSGTTVNANGGYGWGAGFPVGLLAGDGDIPASAIGNTPWQYGLGTTFVETTDVNYRVAMNFLVDSLSDQLIHEDPTFATYGTAGYGFNGNVELRPGWPPTRWRGPYMADTIASDPWGNRYMVNAFALHVPPAGSYAWTAGGQRYNPQFTSATVCLSAGPNETVETFFNQPRGWYTGGDDRTVVLAGAGGIR
jgi:prepilin-type N-terminal cleavage/methylation domain-containing protein